MNDESTALVPVGSTEVSLAIAETPREVVAREKEQAAVLIDIVKQQHLYADIRGKQHLTAEAWSTIGSFNGISPETEWVRPFRNDDEVIVGYEAKVNLVHVPSGKIRASSIMVCGFDDFSGKGKSGTAQIRSVQSTAQTWAMAKAYRQGFSRIAVLAGYSPTPAEELDSNVSVDVSPPERQSRPPSGPQGDGVDEYHRQNAAKDAAEAAAPQQTGPLYQCPIHLKPWFKGEWGERRHGNPICVLRDLALAQIKQISADLGMSDLQVNDKIKAWYKGRTKSKLKTDELVRVWNALKKQLINRPPAPEPEAAPDTAPDPKDELPWDAEQPPAQPESSAEEGEGLKPARAEWPDEFESPQAFFAFCDEHRGMGSDSVVAAAVRIKMLEEGAPSMALGPMIDDSTLHAAIDEAADAFSR